MVSTGSGWAYLACLSPEETARLLSDPVETVTEGVLDRDQRAAVASRNGPTAPCRRAISPDAHRIARPGQGQDRTVAGQRQDACDPGASQETKVENAKPPGFPGG